MSRRARCSEEEYKEAIRSFLSFAPEFSELANWLVDEILATSGNWPEAKDPYGYAERQAVAWFRHNVTDYDADPDFDPDTMWDYGPRSEEHKETCPLCQAEEKCMELEDIATREIEERSIMRREARKEESNSEARSILCHHTKSGSHPPDCPLCDLWRNAS